MVAYNVGVDPVPTAKVCPVVGDAAKIQASIDAAAKDIAAAGKLVVGQA